jgi:GTP cyclohydrolase I
LIQQRFVKDFGGQSSISQEEVLTWLGKESSIMATPHGQRSHGRITVVPKANGSLLDFLSMIDMVERAVATPVQGAVKREDEQEFARLNGQNLVFSEDAARKIAEVLDADKSIGDFMVEAVHYESLHAHDAVAVATKGVLGGLASF